jgi:PAS domain S-box-containing protein
MTENPNEQHGSYTFNDVYWSEDVATGKILFISPSCKKLFGLSPDTLLGTVNALKKIIYRNDLASFEKQYHSLITEAKSIETEFRVIHSNGAVRYLLCRMVPVLDSEGSVIRVEGILSDITKCIERIVESKVKESESQYKELIDSTTEGIGIVDENEVIQYCNPAFVEIFEEESEDNLIGRNLLDYFSDSQKSSILSQTGMRKENIPSQYDLEIISSKNNKKFVLASVLPRLDKNGKYIGAFGTIYDITHHKEAEQEWLEAHHIMEKRVIERTRQLAHVNKELQAEREALQNKNTALKEILNQIEDEKKLIAEQIQSNVDRIISPLLTYLHEKTGPDCEQYISLIKSSLDEITSPFLIKLETRYNKLSPREIEVCDMIKKGFTSKQIAIALGSSEQTVLKQRVSIRKKMGISHKRINLTSFLKRLK